MKCFFYLWTEAYFYWNLTGAWYLSDVSTSNYNFRKRGMKMFVQTIKLPNACHWTCSILYEDVDGLKRDKLHSPMPSMKCIAMFMKKWKKICLGFLTDLCVGSRCISGQTQLLCLSMPWASCSHLGTRWETCESTGRELFPMVMECNSLGKCLPKELSGLKTSQAHQRT